MKHRLQTFLKHKLQWLVLLTALLGVSQGVWGDSLVDDDMWSIKYQVDGGSSQWSDWTDKTTDLNLGTVTSLVLKGYRIHTSGSDGSYVKGTYNINGTTGDYSVNTSNRVSDCSSTCWKWTADDMWTLDMVNLYNKAPGEHTATIKFNIGGNGSDWGGNCQQTCNIKFTYIPEDPTIVGSDGWNNKSWEMSESGTNLVSKSIYIPNAACNYQFKIMDGSNYYGWSNCSSSTKTHANIVEGSDGNIKICTNSPSFGGAIATVTYNTSTHDIDISLQAISSITIHMKNDVNWSPVKIYSWFGDGGEGQKCSGGWSGTEMTGGSGSGTWYSYSTNSCLPEKVIFNNNNSSQTVNITLEYPFCYSVTGTGDNNWTLTTCPCEAPAANFNVNAQLNAGEGSPWAGTMATASTTRSDGYFADEHRRITLSFDAADVHEGNNYYWECTQKPSTATVTWVDEAGTSASPNTIAASGNANRRVDVSLPGVYKFKAYAKCASAGSYNASSVVTITVPYPEIGISGPFIDDWGLAKSHVMTRDGLTWTSTFNAVPSSTGDDKWQFVIVQRYKNGIQCYSDDGIGWEEYNNDGCSSYSKSGNKIIGLDSGAQTLSLYGILGQNGSAWSFNSGDQNNFIPETSWGLAAGNTDEVTLTVTMNSYNNYTVTLCPKPKLSAITAQTACKGEASPTALSFTATAAPNATYQWKSCATEGGEYSSIVGANSATYTPSMGSASANYYKCEVTSNCPSSVSPVVTKSNTTSAAQYTVYATSVAGSIAQKTTGTTSPLGICKDETAILKLTGNTGSIQWQKYNSSTSQFEDISLATSSEYTTTAKGSTGSEYYRAAVTNGVCPTVYTAANTASSYEVVSYNPVNAGTVTLTPNEVCVGDVSTAEVLGVYLAGGAGAWSAGSGASIDSDGNIETSSSGTPTITYTVSSYKCAGTASANATLTIKSTPSFSINADPASGYTAWKPITLSTSPTQTGAVWSITTNHSEAGDATSVGYLSATSGSGTVFKGPAPASSGSNTFVVQATVTDGSSGCSKSVTKNVAVSYEDCE